MKKGFYIRLAGEGISKNRKLYFPYILTCICMIMMYYIVSFLSISKELASIRGGEMLQGLLSMGVFVVAVFALIFLYYTNSFLIRKRKKELGLYNILGMGKRNLVRILLWENILTAVISLVIGIVFGILFSKLAELLAIKLLDGATGFGVHIEMKPILMTVGLFLAIFLLIMIRMLVSVYKLRPIEMLRSENVGEKPPKANWLFAFAGAVILAGAYYLAVKIIDPTTAMLVFFLAVVMVIIATYLLFIAGSVALCKLLQKSKKYYYKTRHFVSLSQMVYRMKRNGAGLASICILSTMVLVTISSTMCIYADTESSIRNRYPHDITIEWSGKTSLPQNEDGTDTELKDSVVQRLTPEMTMTYKEAVEKVLESHKVKAENLENYNLYSLSTYLTLGQSAIIYRDMASYSNKITFEGRVQRDVFVTANELNFPDNSKTLVYGSFNYTSVNEANIPDGIIKGDINFKKIDTSIDTSTLILNYIIRFVATAIFVLVVVLFLIFFTPKAIDRAKYNLIERPFATTGIGILGIALIPFIVVLLMTLSVTLPLAITLAVIYGILVSLAFSFFAIAIAKYLVDKFNLQKKWQLALFTIISALVMYALTIIPAIGGYAKLFFIVVGFGIVLVSIFSKKFEKTDKKETSKKTEKNSNVETKKVEKSNSTENKKENKSEKKSKTKKDKEENK